MPRSREELVEALREQGKAMANAAGLLEGEDLSSEVKASRHAILLAEAADSLDSLEEWEEFRVLGQRGFVLSPVLVDRAQVEGAAAYALNNELGTLQSRTVTRTPWTDVEEGTGGC
jgi:hypothetical protein